MKRKIKKTTPGKGCQKDMKKTVRSKEHLVSAGNAGKKSSESCCHLHLFEKETVRSVRLDLLRWYCANARQLPWRDLAKSELNQNEKGYAIWVSEVMLQQTQVATVINYYKTWMSKWPTVEDLAAASLEEVNQVWAGLGYYSRARSLHQGAQHVCNNLNGLIPTDCSRLMAEVKGIGRYTAAAVGSIAFGQVVGLVDGNVSRVLSRTRAIGSDITKPNTIRHLWKLAEELVDPKEPGNFNQAMMELGATVCLPRKPNCSSCPVKAHCHAFQMKSNLKDSPLETTDIEDIESAVCNLCLPKNSDFHSQGVCAFPQKAKKKAPQKQESLVVILEDGSSAKTEVLMVRRPDKGLLAGLWEFPNFPLDQGQSLTAIKKILTSTLEEQFSLSSAVETAFAGEVLHLFSHIHSTYKVFKVKASASDVVVKGTCPDFRWMTSEEISSAAVPTAMKKVLQCAQNITKVSGLERKRLKINDKSQQTLLNFLTTK